MKIIPTESIHYLDEATIEKQQITSLDLMERAATGLTKAIMSHYDSEMPVVVFAGSGNNGGDALAVARMLGEKGYQVSVYLFNINGRLSDDCTANRDRLMAGVEGVTFIEVTKDLQPPKLCEGILVVDGLFGSGLNKPLSGGFASLVRFINASGATVVSIDVPSGLMGEDNSAILSAANGNVSNSIIHADLTLSIQLPKLSFFFPENEPYFGNVEYIDIQLDQETIDYSSTPYETIDADDVSYLFRSRTRFQYKGNFGHGLLVAGQKGMGGAALLSTRACLRSGIGLLSVQVPAANYLIQQLGAPEAMTIVDDESDFISTVPDLTRYSAIAIGPGIGRRTETGMVLSAVISNSKVPMVIDADALNIISEHPEMLSMLPEGSILTPHPGEMNRLMGRTASSFERLTEAKSWAAQFHIYFILKGAYTMIVTPSGHCYINTTGNPGMATGGMGDALTGILLALLAQGYDSETAAKLGVFVHGLAGDYVENKNGDTSLIASDLISALPFAWKQFE